MNRVLITGATTKLGECVALALSKNGFSPVIHYNSQKNRAESLQKKCESFQESCILQGDFSTQEGVEKFLVSYGPYFKDTYGFVHLYGPTLEKTILETTVGDWKGLYQTNLLSFIQLSQGLVDPIIAHQGRIISMGMPFLGRNKALTKVSAYFAIKSALLSYTLSLAKELVGKATVNMISPSFLENSTILPPLGEKRILEEEVAFWILSLFDEKSQVLTGQNIEITAGFGL